MVGRTPAISNLPHGRRFSIRCEFPRSKPMGKAAILWLIGVPIPVIIILWLLFH
jgi:hypothetical protein